jgi:hypothetical protein
MCSVGLDYWMRMFFGNKWHWDKRLAHHLEDKASFSRYMHKNMTNFETVVLVVLIHSARLHSDD